MFLVVLDRQYIIATSLDDRAGDLLLATDGINGDQRPVQIEHLQQGGDGRDLVGAFRDHHLAQGQVLLDRPGADDLQGVQAAFGAARTPLGLAVDGDVRQVQTAADLVQPGQQAALQGHRIEVVEEPFQGVVAGDTVGQSQEAFQPVVAFAGEGLDVLPGVAVGDHAAQGDDDDVEQVVQPAVF